MTAKDQRDVFLERIYEKHRKKLENYCLLYVGYSSEYYSIIEESVQETFLQAVEDYDVLRTYSPARIEGWLMKTCFNRFSNARDKYRVRKRHNVHLPDDGNLRLPADQISLSLDEFCEKMFDRECLERISSTLNERERNILDMRYQQEMSFEDIAAHEHTTAGAVKGVLARLNIKLKKEVKENRHKYLFFAVSIFLLNRFNK